MSTIEALVVLLVLALIWWLLPLPGIVLAVAVVIVLLAWLAPLVRSRRVR